MKKIFCDRCGSEINGIDVFDPKSIYTHYDIRALIYTSTKHPCDIGGQKIIDLCPSCEKELSKWLSRFEDQLRR